MHKTSEMIQQQLFGLSRIMSHQNLALIHMNLKDHKVSAIDIGMHVNPDKKRELELPRIDKINRSKKPSVWNE